MHEVIEQLLQYPLEMIIGNVFSNFSDVVITANALLQLKFDTAAASAARVLVNTTFGVFGIIDIASDISAVSDININKRNEDFGQTLGRYGIGRSYLVLPFLNPVQYVILWELQWIALFFIRFGRYTLTLIF